MKRTIILMLCLLSAIGLMAQNKSISGVVTDGTGETVIGASVIEVGTSNGTITDLEGKFSLTIAQGKKITISYIGYKPQTLTIGAEKIYNVVLKEDTEVLDEVVVVGYGIKQKRSTLTTSISKLDDKVLENAAIANVASSLQGSVSGLRVTNASGKPGESPSIVLRGGAGIKSSSGPLVVVDGIIRSMDDVNASDVESIQVLKDAASTAIYGARANSGVILVTTKKGKSGSAVVSYKFKGGVNMARTGYEYVGAADYLKYNRMGRYYSEKLGNKTENEILGIIDGEKGYGTSQALFSSRYLEGNEALLQQGWQQMTDPVTGKQIVFQDFNAQLRDATYAKSTFTQDHHISFSGGNEKGAFAASLGYYSEDGVVKGTGYRRFNGSMNGNYKVLPFLNVKAGTTFSTSESPDLYVDDIYSLFYRVQSSRPTWNPYNEDGSPAAGYDWENGNPMYWKEKMTNSNNTRRTTFNVGLDFELIKEKLFLRENSSVYYRDYVKEKFNKAYQSIWQTSTERASSAEYARDIQQQHSVQLEYADTYKGKHNVGGLLGGEFFESKSFELKGTAKGSPFDDIYTMNMASKEGMTAYSYRQGYRISSFFGRVTYDYDRRYLFTAVARYDGVSKLSDGRWGFFPGVSAGWNMHEEAFYKDTKLAEIISSVKPRISYGVNGNVSSLGNYDPYGVYKDKTSYNGSTGILNTSVINPNLRWEKSKSFEVGLDLGFMHNRFNLIIDYYNRTTSDLLTDLDLPGYTGFDSFKTNLGSLRNSGIEIEANLNLISNPKGFSWDFAFNTSFVKNKILKLPYTGLANNRQGGSQIYDPKQGKVVWVGGYQEGQTMGDIYAYKQVRILRDWDDVKANAGDFIDEIANLYGPNKAAEYAGKSGWKPIEPGDVLWDDKDGSKTINSLDREKVGNMFPKWTGGFSTTLSYKNLSLYGRFDYACGHTIYNGLAARTLGQYQGTYNMIVDVLDTWTPENQDADLPKFYYADQSNKRNITRGNTNGGSFVLNDQSSRFYEKGNYLALREVTLNWKLPKTWISKVKLTDASLYVTGQNLFYITSYSGASPEPLITNGDRMGVDEGRYPTPRTVLVGASLSF